MSSLQAVLLVSWGLFVVGVMGLLTRRSAFHMLLALFFLFEGGCLAWVSAVRFYGDGAQSLFAIVLLLVMGLQFLLGLAVLVRSLYYHHSIDVTEQKYLKH